MSLKILVQSIDPDGIMLDFDNIEDAVRFMQIRKTLLGSAEIAIIDYDEFNGVGIA